eukprot:3882706-Pleurochrysis_carterae.AAC.2
MALGLEAQPNLPERGAQLAGAWRRHGRNRGNNHASGERRQRKAPGGKSEQRKAPAVRRDSARRRALRDGAQYLVVRGGDSARRKAMK